LRSASWNTDQRVLLGLGGDGVESAIDDAFGGGLLAVIHQGVHELGEDQIAKFGVRGDFAAFGAVAAGHSLSPYFGRLAP
jgi:hypothetical protein